MFLGAKEMRRAHLFAIRRLAVKIMIDQRKEQREMRQVLRAHSSGISGTIAILQAGVKATYGFNRSE